eukprot:113649-Pyramimonas_sp.AAC.1
MKVVARIKAVDSTDSGRRRRGASRAAVWKAGRTSWCIATGWISRRCGARWRRPARKAGASGP